MESKIKIFETGIPDGIISRNKKFYPESLRQEEIDEIFLQTRIKAGETHGFDGKKIFQASQKKEGKNPYPDGKYLVITEDNMKKEDFWYEFLPADILLITEKYPNIVIGNQMADCPILIAEDRKLGVTALSHCGVQYINRELPIQTIEALVKENGSNLKDIYITITSCAKKENYRYDKYPQWATNSEVWKDFIVQQGEEYHIDMDGAIVNQLKRIGIIHLETSNRDTMTDPYFYSHSGLVRKTKAIAGQNFVGFYYINSENKKNS